MAERRSASGESIPLQMVRLVGQDLVRAEELLEQHDLGELVRQRGGPEREAVLARREVQPGGPPDDEAQVAAGLAAVLEPARERDRVVGVPVAREQRQERPGPAAG